MQRRLVWNILGPYQHFLRAIELPAVRMANIGINAVVDAYGRTVDSRLWAQQA
ncbi:hypothetical protein J1C56_09645 [Aminobacter anthyllidis]|uniref:Uncharacterized protein n=1 Tax=Aminobacter anthyllidis TaxID=1035067 RepID=A0A9X1D5N9_9HYPH|nr:hypothetical protein [Aminobacter anthyllidis]MBT1155853.1 hypothetical protein [Aminobacter anthyllidis]